MFEESLARVKINLRNAPRLLRFFEDALARPYHALQLMRLRSESLASQLRRDRPIRIVATACCNFPIYSQTFVYQELAQLVQGGFDLRFLFSELNPRDQLPPHCSSLWRAKRRLARHPSMYERDFAYFSRKVPEKVQSLVEMLCRASGLSPDELRSQYHFRQAFSYARMVEAFRPDYLHSYFFYEGTLFSLFASHLLDIPRGVSCYSDHLLADYVLKVVPLHLEQCSIVIATSHRIKRELLSLAPHVPSGKILVKPNAIDSGRFPLVPRGEPAKGEPYRLVSVNRIEPKKGVLYLLEALRLLLDRNLNVQWHLLGEVDDNPAGRHYAQAVDARIRELDLAGVAHLEGRKTQAEIRRFLQDSHVFVAPFIETDSGDKDGIPTALLEAMATGIPAVATDAGSIAEVIDDGVDGVLVSQRDPESLSHAIQQLLLDPDRRAHLGQQGAAKIRQRFDVRVCESSFHDRIRLVVAGR